MLSTSQTLAPRQQLPLLIQETSVLGGFDQTPEPSKRAQQQLFSSSQKVQGSFRHLLTSPPLEEVKAASSAHSAGSTATSSCVQAWGGRTPARIGGPSTQACPPLAGSSGPWKAGAAALLRRRPLCLSSWELFSALHHFSLF